MALKSFQDDAHSGSTCLHCDLCDAINIMVFSSPSNGTALWHIFKAANSCKIWAYIWKLYNCTLNDPIHSQCYYLGPPNLERLQKEFGVVPYTIHQSVREAVFIPAGCAHQVCNFLTLQFYSSSCCSQVSNEANCIKVASDFLSVEAIPVCEILAGEFQQENLCNAWKDNFRGFPITIHIYSRAFQAITAISKAASPTPFGEFLITIYSWAFWAIAAIGKFPHWNANCRFKFWSVPPSGQEKCKLRGWSACPE